MKKTIIRIVVIIGAAALIATGLLSGGYKDLKSKASYICLECMGIG